FNNVCDAYIQEPLLIRAATVGENNGAVTIRGYSSAFPNMYAVTNGPDGNIPTPAWQFSPTIENLPPGNYIAHIKDFQGCEDEKTFTIEAPAAYNIRFTTSYKDALGRQTTINILKRDYEG